MSKMRNQRTVIIIFSVLISLVNVDALNSTMNSNNLLPLVNGYLSLDNTTPVCYNYSESYIICLNATVENHYPIRDRYNFSFPEVNVQCQCNCSGPINMAKCSYDGNLKHCLRGWIPYKGRDCYCQLMIDAKGDIYQAVKIENKQRKVRLSVELKEKASQENASQQGIWNYQFLASETENEMGVSLRFHSQPHSDEDLIFDKYRSWFYHRLNSPKLLTSASINGKDERNFDKIGWFKLYNEQEMSKSASYQAELFDALRNYKSSWFACAANKTVYQWHFKGTGYRREGRIAMTQTATSPVAFVDTSSVYVPQPNKQHFRLRVPWNQITLELDAVLNSTLTGFHPKLILEEVSYKPETKEVTTNAFLTVSFDSGTSGFLLGSVNASGSVQYFQVRNTTETYRFPLTNGMNIDTQVCFYSNHSRPICQRAEVHCEEQVNVSGANATIAVVILVILILLNVGLIVWFYRTAKKEKNYQLVRKTQPAETLNDEAV